MDLLKIIEELRVQKEQVERAISSMEALISSQENAAAAVMKRRGRRAMGPENGRKFRSGLSSTGQTGATHHRSDQPSNAFVSVQSIQYGGFLKSANILVLPGLL